MFSNRRSRLIALGLTFMLLLVTVTSVFAATITWTKNGTTNGKCETLINDPTVPAGQQRWLFILTSPMASGPYVLTASFNPATTPNPIVVTGVKKGNGAVHFTLFTKENATLLSASATGGTAGKSVLTVSHCEANPPALRVSKTATTTFTRTYTWDIAKSVDTPELVLFNGTSGTPTYTVNITKTGYIDSAWAVSGTIKIENVSVFTAKITSVADAISGAGAAPVNCGVSFPYNLAAGGTLNCTYSAGLPDGSNRTNTATASTSGVVPGGSGTAPVAFGDPSSVVNATVDVTDTFAGSLGSFSDTDSVSYPRTFTCPQDVGDYPNTATITQTGQSASANIRVDCIAPLEVSKSAQTSFTRTWAWDIAKSVDVNAWNLADGASATSNYTVTVTKTGYVDSAWTVSGTIAIYNPSSIAANITSVSDDISGAGGASVNCGVAFPYSLGAYSNLNCTYSAGLPDGSNRVNTATASTSGVVPGGSGTAPVNFGSPSVVINETVNVTDTFTGAPYGGNLGSFSDTGSKSYSRTFTCAPDAGDHPNTATITETGQSANASVHVNCAPPPPPVPQWCSPGFWKNHQSVWPAGTHGVLYSTIPHVGNDYAGITIDDVISSPSTYGGPATNYVADYLSAAAGLSVTPGLWPNPHVCPF